MSNAKKKPAKKQTAKKAPAKKAVAKKTESKTPAKKKAPAKKAVAKKSSPKPQEPKVIVKTQPSKTSTATTDIKVDFTISGTPETFTSAVSEVIRVNDVVNKSLRKRMLSWFTRK
jgi:hypothetical protein